jgi:N-formylglutamate amidohydrolase
MKEFLPVAAWLLIGRAVAGAAEPSDPLMDVGRGTIPIVISAPHGGQEDVPDVPPRENKDAERFVTGADVNTRELAHKMIAEIESRFGGKPYFCVARFRRRFLDVNRRPEDAYESPGAKFYYDEYHQTLAEHCRDVQKKFDGVGLFIDVHGQATYKGQLLVGTVGGKSVTRLRDRYGDEALVGKDGWIGFLQREEFDTVPALGATDFTVPKYNGGHITQSYGSDRPAGLDAVQFEFGSNLRTKEKLDDTAERAVDAIEAYCRAYLPTALKKAAAGSQ